LTITYVEEAADRRRQGGTVVVEIARTMNEAADPPSA
jgi:hypothetical protein